MQEDSKECYIPHTPKIYPARDPFPAPQYEEAQACPEDINTQQHYPRPSWINTPYHSGSPWYPCPQKAFPHSFDTIGDMPSTYTI